MDRNRVTSDFYEILYLGNGLADVYLYPPDGSALVVRDAPENEATEENIRMNYYSWCAAARTVTERGRCHDSAD